MIPILDEYCSKFLDGEVDKPKTSPELPLGRLHLVAYPPSRENHNLVERAVSAVKQAHTHFRTTLVIDDIYVVCPTNELGQQVATALRAAGLRVSDTYSGSRDSFWEDDHPIKASTPESLKGWESRAVVAVFPNVKNQKMRMGLYVAMTRVKHDLNGSLFSLVTDDKAMLAFADRHGFKNQHATDISNDFRAKSRSVERMPLGSSVWLEIDGEVEVFELVSGSIKGVGNPLSLASPLGQIVARMQVGDEASTQIYPLGPNKVRLIKVESKDRLES